MNFGSQSQNFRLSPSERLVPRLSIVCSLQILYHFPQEVKTVVGLKMQWFSHLPFFKQPCISSSQQFNVPQRFWLDFYRQAFVNIPCECLKILYFARCIQFFYFLSWKQISSLQSLDINKDDVSFCLLWKLVRCDLWLRNNEPRIFQEL